MPATLSDLDDFHRFAADEVRNSPESPEFKDLVREWLRRRERDEVNAIIRQGIADIDSGLGRPAREVMEELRAQHGIPE
jgi:hypothetical protein